MDILKDERLRSYNKISRYQQFPYYYNTLDEKYMYGTTGLLDDTKEYTTYVIKQGDSLDSLALDAYNTPTLYWVIADFNRIQDPFITLPAGFTIKIPNLSDLEFLNM